MGVRTRRTCTCSFGGIEHALPSLCLPDTGNALVHLQKGGLGEGGRQPSSGRRGRVLGSGMQAHSRLDRLAQRQGANRSKVAGSPGFWAAVRWAEPEARKKVLSTGTAPAEHEHEEGLSRGGIACKVPSRLLHSMETLHPASLRALALLAAPYPAYPVVPCVAQG